jgi:hypothetical protein
LFLLRRRPHPQGLARVNWSPHADLKDEEKLDMFDIGARVDYAMKLIKQAFGVAESSE